MTLALICVVLVCATVIALAVMALVYARENRVERIAARTTRTDLKAFEDACEERFVELERKADGWDVTKRQVAALTERRKS